MQQIAPKQNHLVEKAQIATRLFALDPIGLSGVIVVSRSPEMRRLWLDCLVGLIPEERPVRKVPLNVTVDRLIGGLDLAATLHSGRPVGEFGLLAGADSGLVVVSALKQCVVRMADHIVIVDDDTSIGFFDTSCHPQPRHQPRRRTPSARSGSDIGDRCHTLAVIRNMQSA